MSDYTISIPDSLYDKAQRLAQQTSQTIGDVIRARMIGALDQPALDLPTDEQAELRALSYLSDDCAGADARGVVIASIPAAR